MVNLGLCRKSLNMKRWSAKYQDDQLLADLFDSKPKLQLKSHAELAGQIATGNSVHSLPRKKPKPKTIVAMRWTLPFFFQVGYFMNTTWKIHSVGFSVSKFNSRKLCEHSTWRTYLNIVTIVVYSMRSMYQEELNSNNKNQISSLRRPTSYVCMGHCLS